MTSSGTLLQALLAAAVTSVLVWFGYPSAGVIMALVGGLLALLLLVANWRAIGFSRSEPIPWLVGASPFLLAGAPWLALGEVPDTRMGSPNHELAVFVIVVLAAIVFLVMYLSSLVDWCYVLPRLRGGAGMRPCTDSLDPYWRQITRVWFLHRLVAAVTLVAANIAVVAIAAIEWVHLGLDQVVAAALAAAATVLAGFYLSRLPFAVAMMVNPPLYVGDKVQLAEAFPQPAECPHYYVSEISLEGVKLVELDEEDVRARPDPHRSYDRMLDLTEVHKLLRARDVFAPCVGCKGVNPYCGRSFARRDISRG